MFMCLPQTPQLFRQLTFIKAVFFWHSPFLAQPGQWALCLRLSSQLELGEVTPATVMHKCWVLRYFENPPPPPHAGTIVESLSNNILIKVLKYQLSTLKGHDTVPRNFRPMLLIFFVGPGNFPGFQRQCLLQYYNQRAKHFAAKFSKLFYCECLS